MPPIARSQFGMAADAHGNIYILGGRAASSSPLADFWRFIAGSHTWEALPNLIVPPLVEPHLAVDAAGNVFEFGGVGTPGFPHFSADGHNYGLYEYLPAQATWIDRTPSNPTPGVNWPAGREDFGFVYDRASGQFFVFGGEGAGGEALNDLWSYNEQDRGWKRITPSYAGSHSEPIAPRELYNLSDDNHGGFYLYGGSYLMPAQPEKTPPLYVNDLWRYDIATHTWTLLAGKANDYDALLPLPRQYYGQAGDPAGNLDILGGYVSDTRSPPYFAGDRSFGYARPVRLQGPADPPGLRQYALDDFWQYNARDSRWIDLSEELGGLRDSPAIPYMMALDSEDHELVTFGGFHAGVAGTPDYLTASNQLWTYPLS